MEPSEKLCWKCGKNVCGACFQCAGPCERFQHFICKEKNNECQSADMNIIKSMSLVPNFYCPECIDELPSGDYSKVGISESVINSSKEKFLNDNNIVKCTLNLQYSTSNENSQEINISSMDRETCLSNESLKEIDMLATNTNTCRINETLQKIDILSEKIKSSVSMY